MVIPMHLIRFSLFNCVIWFVFGKDIEILTDWDADVEYCGDKNFDIRTSGCIFKYSEEANYLRMILILLYIFCSMI